MKLVKLAPTTKGSRVQMKKLLKIKGSPLLYLAETLRESVEFARVICVNRAYMKSQVIEKELY